MKLWKPLLLGAALFAVAGGVRGQSIADGTNRTFSSPAALLQAQAQPQAPVAQKPEGEVDRITVDQLKAKLAKNEPVFIIDSRSQGAWASSEMKIRGAVRIPMDEIESRLKEIPRDKEIVVYCT